MSNPLYLEDSDFHSSIQENLKELSAQLGSPLDKASVKQIYQNACDLLSHVSPSPLTLARVAGTLLVYRVKEIEPQEIEWFNTQIKQCLDEEEVEELIESLSRTDSL
jgi:Tfp pilus assembly protein FimV